MADSKSYKIISKMSGDAIYGQKVIYFGENTVSEDEIEALNADQIFRAHKENGFISVVEIDAEIAPFVIETEIAEK